MSKATSTETSKQSQTSQPDAAAPSTATAQETPHARFQSASERYYGDVNAIWSDAQKRVQDLQLDFMKAQVELGHKQPPPDAQSQQAEFQALQEKFQKQFEEVANDPEPVKRLTGAYDTYRDAVLKGFAGADGNALDPVALGLIAQQVLSVCQVAEQIRLCVTRPDVEPEA